MFKEVETQKLFKNIPEHLKGLFSSQYPWEILPKIKDFIKEFIESAPEGYTQIGEGILVGENVKIAETATIIAPAIIGKDTEIRPGAYIRGNVIIGEGCVIGNSTELKNCILLSKAQVPHYNYVGDSILGFHAHMGAGAVCSNLKADGKAVIIRGEENYETGLRKVGGFLGDNADIGCGCVVNPGTIVGIKTSVYPLTALRGVYPQNCIVKDAKTYIERILKPRQEFLPCFFCYIREISS